MGGKAMIIQMIQSQILSKYAILFWGGSDDWVGK